MIAPMTPKRPGPLAAKSRRRTGSPCASSDGEGRKANVASRSHELEDQDVTKMAQKMMDAVDSIVSRHLTVLADSSSDQEKASDSTG